MNIAVASRCSIFERAQLEKRHGTLGYIKLAILVSGVITAIWILAAHIDWIYFVLVPAILFVVAAIVHERVLSAPAADAPESSPSTNAASPASAINGREKARPANASRITPIHIRAISISSGRARFSNC